MEGVGERSCTEFSALPAESTRADFVPEWRTAVEIEGGAARVYQLAKSFSNPPFRTTSVPGLVAYGVPPHVQEPASEPGTSTNNDIVRRHTASDATASRTALPLS